MAGRLLRGVEGSAYVRGGTARDQPLWGVSDIDIFCVVAGEAERGATRTRILERWHRMRRRLPGIEAIVSVGAYEDRDLAESVSDPYLTHGLRAAPDAPLRERALYYPRRAGSDEAWLRTRPGLFGPLSDWRLVHGQPRLPATPEQNPDRRRIAAWGDLQHWWLFAFARCLDPAHFTTSYLAAKLIVEPVRILIWLDEERPIWRRPEVIEAGLNAYPAHREALVLARELMRRPLGGAAGSDEDAHRRALEAAFPHFMTLSGEVAGRIEAGIEGERTSVRLDGEVESPGPALPLCDWRGLCVRHEPDELLIPLGAEVAPATVAESIGRHSPGRQPVLTGEGSLLVLPAPEGFLQLRRVAGAVSDPVSSALMRGERTAGFYPARGFSAEDWARRAVAEREAQLATVAAEPSSARIGLLLAAARAGLFAQSITEGDPCLALTGRTAATMLAELDPPRAGAIETAAGEYYRGAGAVPDPGAVAELEASVAELLVEVGAAGAAL